MSWTFVIVSALIAIVCVILAIVLDIDDFRDRTIGEYILMFIWSCIPIFNIAIIILVGGMVLIAGFEYITKIKFFEFLNKKPFEK